MMMTYCMWWHQRRQKQRGTNCILYVLFLPTQKRKMNDKIFSYSNALERFKYMCVFKRKSSHRIDRALSQEEKHKTNAVTWEFRTCRNADTSLSNDSMYTSTKSVGSRPDFFLSFWILFTIYITQGTNSSWAPHRKKNDKIQKILIRKCIPTVSSKQPCGILRNIYIPREQHLLHTTNHLLVDPKSPKHHLHHERKKILQVIINRRAPVID